MSTIQTKRAKRILHNNIWTKEDWTENYGLEFEYSEYSKEDMRTAFNFPWGVNILKSACPFHAGKLIKDTHFAFFGIPTVHKRPLTIAKWINMQLRAQVPNITCQELIIHEYPSVYLSALEPRWYLILKDIIPRSLNKTPEDQAVILPPEYELPRTVEETTKNILLFKKTGKRHNAGVGAVCKERAITCEGSMHSAVGWVARNGMNVYDWTKGKCRDIGIAASRKL